MKQVEAIDPNRPNETANHNRTVGSSGNCPDLRLLAAIVLGWAIVGLTGCATKSHHKFAEPSREWQTRSGQLMYRTPKATLIGEVVVRFSKNGDFELTFSKGPGVTLFSLRQNATFADIKGAMAGRGWSGPIERAPKQLHGWLELRDKLIASQNRASLRHTNGAETFVFRF